MAIKRKKKKEWIPIVSPEYLGKKEIGEILVDEKEKAIGRRIILSVIDVTGDYNKYYMKIGFMVTKVQDGKALLDFDSIECLRDYIARMVLRRVTRIDAIQDLKTKDGYLLRVKSIIVVYSKITRDIQRKLRSKAEEMIKNFVENSDIGNFVNSVLNDSWKNKIIKELNKIYPVRYFEFRKIEVKKRPSQ
ncbi:MAG: hypothetical protein B6U78_02865 [Candidatus Aenigmarchaeota archaeon ex4484_224]|nr:MAG: hypothetical protein B6U78_02865 [Candidatus Aenigmarchaeota archaeon ex4484_224]